MNRRAFLGGSLTALSLALLPTLSRAQDASRKQILIGQSVDLSGTMQNIGHDYFAGAKMAFDQANAAGGLGGRQIRLTQLDDGGDPARAVANAKRLIDEEKVDLLFGLTGEACVEAVSNCTAFRNSDIELFAPVSGVDHVGAKGRVVYLRPGGAEEMISIAERFAKMSLRKTAVVHTVSPSMLAMRDAALAGLKDRAPKAYALKDAATNAAAIAVAIEQAGIQAVVIMADSISAALLVRQLRPRLPGLFICLGSMVDVISVQELVGLNLARGLMVSRVVPDPENVVVPVVADYRRSLKKYLDQPPTAAGLEGFIAAQALLAVLRRSDNPRHFVAAAQRRGMLDVGGWKLDFARSRAVSKVEMAMLTAEGKLL